MTEQKFRSTITWTSFLFTILVIWAHAGNAELFLGEAGRSGPAALIENLLGDIAAQIAVPGFFMISSVLFFRNYTPEKTAEKWRHRVRSLLIPYLLWNAIYLAGYMIASRIPGISDVVGKGVITPGPAELLRAVGLYEYNYGFWYVFQLLLLTLLSPLVYIAAQSTPAAAGALAALSVCIALRFDPTPVNADALFYYLAAAWLVVRREKAVVRRQKAGGTEGRTEGRTEVRTKGGTAGFSRPEWRYAAVLFILFLLFHYAAFRTGNDLPLVLCRCAGALAVWCLFSGLCLPEPAYIMRETFLIYAIHFAPVRLVNKTLNLVLHGNSAAAVGIFLLLPGFILLLTAFGIRIGKKYFPAVLTLLSGGRT